MILFQQVRKFSLTISLVVFIATAITFGFAPKNSWAATPLIASSNQPSSQIAFGWGKAKAATKGMEGNVQEAVGDLTGNRKDQVMGRAKQAESRARSGEAEAKEAMQSKVKSGEDKLKKAADKSREEIRDKTNQAERNANNAVKDMKAKGREMLK